MKYITIVFYLLVFVFAPCWPGAFAAEAASNADIATLRDEIAGLRSEMSAMREKYEATIARLEAQVNRLGSGTCEPAAPVLQSAQVASSPADERERLWLAAAGALGAAGLETATVATPSAQTVTFKAGELGQQALNPEISMTGDVIAQFRRPASDPGNHAAAEACLTLAGQSCGRGP